MAQQDRECGKRETGKGGVLEKKRKSEGNARETERERGREQEIPTELERKIGSI